MKMLKQCFWLSIFLIINANCATTELTTLMLVLGENDTTQQTFKLNDIPKSLINESFYLGYITEKAETDFSCNLIKVTFDNTTNSYVKNISQTSNTYTSETLVKTICEVINYLNKNFLEIESLIFAQNTDLGTTLTSTPWTSIPDTPSLRNSYFSLADFGNFLREFISIYKKKFNSITITKTPCAFELARELSFATNTLITTNDPLAQTSNQQNLAITQSTETNNTILSILLDVIGNWFSFSSEKKSYHKSEENKLLLALSRSSCNNHYTAIDCNKTYAISRNIALLLNKFFGNAEFDEHLLRSKPKSKMTGLDQMSIKLTGNLLFNLLLANKAVIQNHRIDASLLCALLAQATQERIKDLTNQNPSAQFKNIYMKNKKIVPLLEEIYKLSIETSQLVQHAMINGSCSLYIAFPDQIADDHYPDSCFMEETRIDRLYLLLQVHGLIYDELVSQQALEA